MPRGDIVKDDSGSHAVFTVQGSSACQMTAAKAMDVTQYQLTLKCKNKNAPKFLKTKVRMSRDEDTSYVKSIPPTTENWLRTLYTYSQKNYKSTEDKHETNHINNKYNDTNMNTRKMHNT